jgi:hypothetical protein
VHHHKFNASFAPDRVSSRWQMTTRTPSNPVWKPLPLSMLGANSPWGRGYEDGAGWRHIFQFPPPRLPSLSVFHGASLVEL